MKALKKSPQKNFSAVFADNYIIGMGGLRALYEAGRKVPAEVSVVGLKNMPESRFFNPPLTTATSDFDVMARESLDILFARIHGTPRAALTRVFRPDLVVRKSTGRRGARGERTLVRSDSRLGTRTGSDAL